MQESFALMKIGPHHSEEEHIATPQIEEQEEAIVAEERVSFVRRCLIHIKRQARTIGSQGNLGVIIVAPFITEVPLNDRSLAEEVSLSMPLPHFS